MKGNYEMTKGKATLVNGHLFSIYSSRFPKGAAVAEVMSATESAERD
jgi:hypothetical protein